MKALFNEKTEGGDGKGRTGAGGIRKQTGSQHKDTAHKQTSRSCHSGAHCDNIKPNIYP